MSEISLKEYAIKHNIHPATARQRALRGAFKTARRVGRDWVIDSEEPLVDHRYSDSDKIELKVDHIVMYHFGDEELVEFEDVDAANEQEAVDQIRTTRPGAIITEVYRKVSNWK